MSFNSLWFIFWFLIFYVGYLLLNKNIRLQNFYLLAANLIFYATWDILLPLVLVLTTTAAFFIALRMDQAEDDRLRKSALTLILMLCLGVSVVFKYSNFLLNSLSGFFSGGTTRWVLTSAGISFYLFQLMGYVLDVYHRRLPACKTPRCQRPAFPSPTGQSARPAPQP